MIHHDINFDDNDVRFEDMRTADLIRTVIEMEGRGEPIPVDLIAVLEARGFHIDI